MKRTVLKISITAMLLAIGWLLPLLTGNIPTIGSMLSPMHIPVFICGLLLGPWYGLGLGLILPITRSFLFGAPPLFPNAVGMMVELGVYGLISGLTLKLLNKKSKNVSIFSIYFALLIAMILGRILWGATRYFISFIPEQNAFTFKMFLKGAFISAWPGIILHLLIIPPIVKALSKLSLFSNKKEA